MTVAERLAAIKARLAAATKGPWHAERNPMRFDGWFVLRERGVSEEPAYAGQLKPAVIPVQLPHNDAALIAAAPTDLAWLLRLVDYLAPCNALDTTPRRGLDPMDAAEFEKETP